MKKSSGIELIAKERNEQLEKHGCTTEMDIAYNSEKQLSVAAKRLLDFDAADMAQPMNWNVQIWSKMISKTYEERLIIAGALIAAEIDRLNATE